MEDWNKQSFSQDEDTICDLPLKVLIPWVVAIFIGIIGLGFMGLELMEMNEEKKIEQKHQSIEMRTEKKLKKVYQQLGLEEN